MAIRTNTGRHSSRNTFLACLAVITVAAVIAAAFLFLDGKKSAPKQAPPAVSDGFDPAAPAGTLEGAQAGPLGAADVFNYRINRQITVQKGEANVRIENPPENRQLMKVTLTLSDGTAVYTTGLIKPYYSIETDRLDVTPKKGTYQATATIEAYDRATRGFLSSAEESVQITVG